MCHEKGHISLECKMYSEIKGNMRHLWLKKMKENEWNNEEEEGEEIPDIHLSL